MLSIYQCMLSTVTLNFTLQGCICIPGCVDDQFYVHHYISVMQFILNFTKQDQGLGHSGGLLYLCKPESAQSNYIPYITIASRYDLADICKTIF